jgi:hypothetical protein
LAADGAPSEQGATPRPLAISLGSCVALGLTIIALVAASRSSPDGVSPAWPSAPRLQDSPPPGLTLDRADLRLSLVEVATDGGGYTATLRFENGSDAPLAVSAGKADTVLVSATGGLCTLAAAASVHGHVEPRGAKNFTLRFPLKSCLEPLAADAQTRLGGSITIGRGSNLELLPFTLGDARPAKADSGRDRL